MNAAALASFHEQGQMTREALNPGRVRISGQQYEAAVVLGEMHHVPHDGGTLRRQLCHVTIRKELMPTPPAKEALLTAVFPDFTIDFKIDYVDGHNVTDIAWSIQAARFPQ